jgi:hypothetical protein
MHLQCTLREVSAHESGQVAAWDQTGDDTCALFADADDEASEVGPPPEDKCHPSDGRRQDKFHPSEGRKQNKCHPSDGRQQDKCGPSDGGQMPSRASGGGLRESKSPPRAPVDPFPSLDQQHPDMYHASNGRRYPSHNGSGAGRNRACPRRYTIYEYCYYYGVLL